MASQLCNGVSLCFHSCLCTKLFLSVLLALVWFLFYSSILYANPYPFHTGICAVLSYYGLSELFWRFLTFVISSDEAQNVLMSQHDSLVDLSLTEPGALLAGREDLHSHLLTTPFTPPYLPKTPFPNAFLEDDGPGDGPLDQQRQAWWEADRNMYI